MGAMMSGSGCATRSAAQESDKGTLRRQCVVGAGASPAFVIRGLIRVMIQVVGVTVTGTPAPRFSAQVPTRNLNWPGPSGGLMVLSESWVRARLAGHWHATGRPAQATDAARPGRSGVEYTCP